MYRLFRRISGTLTSRLERVWWTPSTATADASTPSVDAGEARACYHIHRRLQTCILMTFLPMHDPTAAPSSSSSAAPVEIGTKRRRVEVDDEDEDVDFLASAVAKRSRVVGVRPEALTGADEKNSLEERVEEAEEADVDADADADGDADADTSALETLTQGTSEASFSLPSTPVKEKDGKTADVEVKVAEEEEENKVGVDGAEETVIELAQLASSPVKSSNLPSSEVVPSSDNEDDEDNALEAPSSEDAHASDSAAESTEDARDEPERIVPQSTSTTSAILVQ